LFSIKKNVFTKLVYTKSNIHKEINVLFFKMRETCYLIEYSSINFEALYIQSILKLCIFFFL